MICERWTRERGGANYLCAISTPATVGGCTPGLTFTPPGVAGTSLAFDQSLEWFGTARLRGGWLASPRTLLYVTGGLAYGGLKTSAAVAGVNGNGVAITAAGSTTDTRVGWTIGARVEGMLARTGSPSSNISTWISAASEAGTVSLAPIALIAARVDTNFTGHILRAGINYKFGGPVVAKY
jgi:outer membrane immunogenic protein